MEMKEVLIAAMKKNKGESSDNKQKDVAKGLQDAMERARRKFLSEHPEAAKRPFGKTPSQEEQKKEAKKRKKETRKDPMSSQNHFSMSYVEEKDYSQFGWYQRKYATFARKKGSKDKKKRKKKGTGRVAKIALGTLAGVLAGRALGARAGTALAKRGAYNKRILLQQASRGAEIGNVGGAVLGGGATVLATRKKKKKS